ncbi:MAG TPA: hypothetical protein VF944_11925 [Candidatus Bathyarchaeia archaeon]
MPHFAEADEVRRRSIYLLTSISEQLLSLSARDYPTESPKRFIAYLERLVSGLHRLLLADDNTDTIKLICRFVKDLGSHVRFLETASYPRIPWAVIAPMENLMTSIVPEAEIVLRAQWSWNYRIRQIASLYKEALEALPHEYFNDSVFAANSPAWNVVSLPTMDRGNILMHVILGHEVGHRIADQFLSGEDEQALQQEILALVGDGKWFDINIEQNGPLFAMNIKAALFRQINDMRSGGLQELISDIVAFHLFGPSFLFAIRESSLDSVLDGVPIPRSYHPPWRYRYRQVIREYQRQGYPPLLASLGGSLILDTIRQACLRQLEDIVDLTQDTTDIQAIQGDKIATRAYQLIERVVPQIPSFVESKLQGLAFVPNEFKVMQEQLLSRIALGIPPAEVDGKVVNFRDVILAGWLYRISRLPVPFSAAAVVSVEDDITLQRLVHKALEYTNTIEEYGRWHNQEKGD